MHATTRVGNDKRACAQGTHDADWEDNLLHRVALVPVEPTLHGDDPFATDPPDQQTTRMRLHGGEWEPWNILVAYGGLVTDGPRPLAFQLLREPAQAGA